MKTLKKITPAILMIVLFHTISLGASFKKFTMVINEQSTIEVLSKVESLVEENLIFIHTSRHNSHSSQVMIVPVKEEIPVNEEMVIPGAKKQRITDEELGSILRDITKPEKIIAEDEVSLIMNLSK